MGPSRLAFRHATVVSLAVDSFHSVPRTEIDEGARTGPAVDSPGRGGRGRGRQGRCAARDRSAEALRPWVHERPEGECVRKALIRIVCNGTEPLAAAAREGTK